MKTFKNILSLLLAFMLISAAAIAQQGAQNELTPKDPKAKAVLDKLSKKTKSYSTIAADFAYNLSNEGEGLDETQKGNIQIKGDKYIATLGNQKIISNGKNVWTYLMDVEEVQLTEVSEDDESSIMNPKTLFTLYENGFKYAHKGTETEGGKTLDVINLYPTDPGEKPYHTVIMRIEQEKTQIHSITIKMKDGNTFSYTLTNFKPNQTMPDSQFNFTVPEDAELIDLR